MRLAEVFPSKFLKAEDLADGNGGYRRVTVRIRETVMQDIGGDKAERKAVIYFAGKDKGLVSNRTNADELQTIIGSDDTDNWNGYRVMLFVERVPFQGKKVPALRICAAAQEPAKPTAARVAPKAAVAAAPPRRPAAPPPPDPEDDTFEPEPAGEWAADAEPDREPGDDDGIPF